MSLKTWQEEYYPVEAADVPESDALAHSIRKWEGLKPENLARHEVERGTAPCCISDQVGTFMPIDSHTCALCVHFYGVGDDQDYYNDDYEFDEERFEADRCRDCPLSIARGGVHCDQNRQDEPMSPWSAWSYTGDAEPMLTWLRRAQKEAK